MFRSALYEVAPYEIVEGARGMTLAQVPERHVFFIERGYGQSRRSDWMLGAFFAAIYIAACEFGPVNPMDLREWKQAVTKVAGIGLTAKGDGNGNAKKEVANEATRALLALVEVDGTAWTPDELDAYGIAWTGRRLNARAVEAAA